MKISELGLAGAIAGTEVFPIVQGGVTKKVSITDALAGAGGGVTELNGLTGALAITSTDNSVTITPSVDTIDLSVAGGGGGVNPTDTFIPYNKQGTFDDSFLQNDFAGSILKTIYLGNLNGLYLDFPNADYYIGIGASFPLHIAGDTTVIIDSNTNGLLINPGNVFLKTSNYGFFGSEILAFIGESSFSFNIEKDTLNSNQKIYSKYGGAEIGLVLNFLDNKYILTDNAIESGIKNDGNSVFYTALVADGVTDGIRIDIPGNRYNFGSLVGQFDVQVDAGNKTIKIGDYVGAGQANQFILDELTGDILLKASNSITLYKGNAGVILNGGTSLLCDPDGNGNANYFGLDDTNERLTSSANLLTSSSGSASGQHLKINVAGTDYVIELKNP